MIRATFKGTLGQDLEIKYLEGGTALLNFSVATQRQAKVGENWESVTDWINCIAWGRKAEIIAEWFGKGGQIIIHGTFETRNWEDADGNKRYGWQWRVDDFEFVGKKDKGAASSTPDPKDKEEDHDDIPF